MDIVIILILHFKPPLILNVAIIIICPKIIYKSKLVLQVNGAVVVVISICLACVSFAK